MGLEKTTRLHLLYDFYQGLLTEKQRLFFELHFDDDLSLGEIAEEHQISRQAVYEHVKRAEEMLLYYEEVLQLKEKHEKRKAHLQEAASLLARLNASSGDQENGLVDQICQLHNQTLALD